VTARWQLGHSVQPATEPTNPHTVTAESASETVNNNKIVNKKANEPGNLVKNPVI